MDPCGENGEFHSFVFQGPLFRNKIEFTLGEVVLRDERFYFQDLIPIKNNIYSFRFCPRFLVFFNVQVDGLVPVIRFDYARSSAFPEEQVHEVAGLLSPYLH